MADSDSDSWICPKCDHAALPDNENFKTLVYSRVDPYAELRGCDSSHMVTGDRLADSGHCTSQFLNSDG